MQEMFDAGYTESATSTALENTEVEQTIAGQKIMVSADRYMIDKTIKNPTKFIAASGFSSNWAALTNNFLWGNPEGYNYPRMGATYKSVFDPCPNGYRVAPKDLWINFLVDVSMTGNKYYYNVKGGGSNSSSFKRGWTFYYKGMGTVTLDKDGTTAIGYTEPQGTEGIDRATDFYVTSGIRSATGWLYVGAAGCYWSNTLLANANSNASRLDFNGNLLSPMVDCNRGYGLPLRCVKEN